MSATEVGQPYWRNKVDSVRVYYEPVTRAPTLTHDASRPYVVVRRGYRRGGGVQWQLVERYESLAQAKRRAYRG